MALGKRAQEQQELWVATTELARGPGHPFYQKLNELLAEAKFDEWVEKRCAEYYAKDGRPSIPPGIFFRMILVGYFEGIASQRGIAWRCSDSRSLADFLGYGPTETTPEHSSLTRVHQRLPAEVHKEVFQFVLRIAVAKGLVQGTTVAVDSTTLEANAAMKSIVRKDTKEDWQAYLTRLAKAAGIENPTAEELRRFDKNRPNKKVSNTEWESRTDSDSHITKMKDGTTHLAYKAEHVVDLASDLVLAATVHAGTAPDPETLCDSVIEAQLNLQEAGSTAEIRDAAADKGYHAADTVEQASSLQFRTYIPERKQKGRRTWKDKPEGQQEAVYANRRRMRGARGKRLQRKRSEMTERTFAHVCETGGARRCWLRGLVKVTKRYLLQVAARNLSAILRKLFGVETARSLQGDGGLFVWTRFVLYWWSARERERWWATAPFTARARAA